MRSKLRLFNVNRLPDLYVKSLKVAQLLRLTQFPLLFPWLHKPKNYLICESEGNSDLEWFSQLLLNIQLWCGLHNS